MKDTRPRSGFWITNLAVNNPISMVVLVIIIGIIGLMAYKSIPKEDNPEIKFPYVFVSTVYPGASPQDVETLITKPIEKQLKSISDVKKVTSVSQEGFSSTFIEFNAKVDNESAIQRVRDKVNSARPDLPSDVTETRVDEFSFERFPVMVLVLSGPFDVVQLKAFAKTLQDRLDMVKGVLGTQIVGGRDRELGVLVDTLKQRDANVSFDTIINTIRNENVNVPGGLIKVGNMNYVVRVPGDIKDPEVLGNLVVDSADGGPVHVRDIAQVSDGYKPVTSLSRYNGNRSVSIIVTRRSGENLIQLSRDVTKILADMRAQFPQKLQIDVVGDRAQNIISMVSELVNGIITSVILVILVLLVYLGARNSTYVGIAIPLSMLITFFVLSIMGITLNMVVLFALILVLGMLVDDGIVVLEVIYRHMEEGQDRITAAKLGTAEVAWPVITSTLTKLAAFGPLLFWPGIVGQFMKYLPITLVISLLASLFVALCVTPVLCSLYMTKPKQTQPGMDRFEQNAVLRVFKRTLTHVISDDTNRPSAWRRILTNSGVFIATIIYFILCNRWKSGIEYASTGWVTHWVKMLDNFGPALFLATVGCGLLVAVVIIGNRLDAHPISRFVKLGIGSIACLCLISVPFMDIGTGWARLIGGGGLLGMIFAVAWGYNRFEWPSISRSLAMHGFIILFFASLLAMRGMNVIFFPAITPERARVNIELPKGSTIDTTDGIIRRVEAVVGEFMHRPGTNIQHILTTVGSTAADPFSIGTDVANAGSIQIDFFKKEALQAIAKEHHRNYDSVDPFRTISDLRQAVSQIPGGKITVEEDKKGPQSGKPISIEIGGDDLAVLTQLTRQVSQIVKSIGGIVNVTNTLGEGSPELVISIDRQKAAVLGINTSGIAGTIRSAINGAKASTYRNFDDDIDIVVKLEKDQANNLDQLNYLMIAGKNGEWIPLSQVATVTTAPGFGSITRVDFKRVVNVEADISRESNQTAANAKQKIEAALSKISIPNGVTVQFKGEDADQKESQSFLGKSFLIAILIIGLIMVTEFNSVIYPLIILFSIVLSIIGVVLGLLVAPTIFRGVVGTPTFVIIMTGVGVISLAGVVVNNAIVLIDYIQQRRLMGDSRTDAIIYATIIRFRPVMLTAATAILGLFPMAMGVSFDFTNRIWGIVPKLILGASSAEWWAPLADAIIFGLAIATILTLLMVPIAYYILDELPTKIWNRLKLNG